MVYQDVAFLRFRANFFTTSLKNVVEVKSQNHHMSENCGCG